MDKIEERLYKINLYLGIVMAGFTGIIAILQPSIEYAAMAFLWGAIALNECTNKMKERKYNERLEMYKDNIDLWQSWFLDVNKELSIYENMRYIKLEKIQIPEKFTKPKDKKMKKRTDFYKKNGNFYVPIIVDKDNVLLDGYTSYLIAKRRHFSHIPVIVKEK